MWAAWLDPDPVPPLSVLVEESYLDLLESADEFNFSKKELDGFKKQLKAERKAEKEKLKSEEKSLKKEIEATREQLTELNRSKSRDTLDMGQERSDLHCQVRTWRSVCRRRSRSASSCWLSATTTSWPSWSSSRSGRRRSFRLKTTSTRLGPGNAATEMPRTLEFG